MLMALALGAALFEDVGGINSSGAPAAPRAHAFTRESLLALPASARGPAASALGAEDPAYRTGAAPGGFTAPNPAQRLTTTFTKAGVLVSSGSARVGMRLRAVGFGSSLTAVPEVAPDAHHNRVLYAHHYLSEWYSNGPLGLEQGFTLAAAPSRHAAGPLTLAIDLSGNLHASLSEDGQSIVLSRAGRPALRYTGLSVADAHGRALHSWLQADGRELLLRVDADGARFPLHVDPFIRQFDDLRSLNGEVGAPLAVDGDGNVILLDDQFYEQDPNPPHLFKGAVSVFVRTGETWSEREKLTGGSEEVGYGEFGSCGLALSGDGETALIGACADNGEEGAAFVFRYQTGKFTQQGPKLVGGSEEVGNGAFGTGAALSSNGETALIGGSYDNNYQGAAWVFKYVGGKWTQEGKKFTATTNDNQAEFGRDVALSGNGAYALIGGPTDNQEEGGAWVFAPVSGQWEQQAELVRGVQPPGKDYFGFSVAIDETGDTALVGSPVYAGDYPTLVDPPGAVWEYTRSGATWTRQGAHMAGHSFGQGVAISANGKTVLVGGSAEQESGADHNGEAWVYERTAPDAWTQIGPTIEEAGNSLFGQEAGLSADGETAIVADNGTVLVARPPGPTAASKGSVTGNVEVISPPGTTINNLTSGPPPSGLPSGTATVGALSYTITGSFKLGETIKVTFLTPSPVAKVFKYDASATPQWEEYKRIDIHGDEVTMELTDASGTGTGDQQSPAVAGEIVDPVVLAGPSAPPSAEYGQCRALTKDSVPKVKHGKYEDAACQKLYEKKGVVEAKGGYEWYPGAPANCVAQKKGEYVSASCSEKAAKAHKGTFERQACYPNCEKYTSTAGRTVWQISNYATHGAVATVECTAGTDTGEITGPTSDTDTIAWTGCHVLETTKECRGLNPVPKEIETSPNATAPLARGSEAYTVYSNAFNDIYAVFECEGIGYVEVRGAIEGVTTGDFNVMNTGSMTVFDEAFSEPGELYETLAKYDKGEPKFKTTDVLESTSTATGAEMEIKGG